MAEAPAAASPALHPPGNPKEGSAHLLRLRDAPSVVTWWWRDGKWSGNSDAQRDKRDTTHSPLKMAALGWTYVAPRAETRE